MNGRQCATSLCLFVLLSSTGLGAPVIDPISNVTIPAGKSLIVPVTATSPTGQPLTYTATSSTNGIAVGCKSWNTPMNMGVREETPE